MKGYQYYVISLVLFVTLIFAQRPRYKDDYYNKRTNKKKKSDKPNIIVIMTDDQDEALGSMHVMPKTLKWMRDQGVQFNNSFVSTPMCCPSRSSFLTGVYTHNHHVYTNNDNCSSPYWQANHEPRSFATYLSNAGYRTGYFGKYLNEYNGTYIPTGWREWLGLVRNSRFYNYTVNFNGQKMKHADNYYQDYFTDLIANDSVTFLKRSKQYFPKRPVLMVLSTPAPHGPEDSAPQYQHLFYNNTFHRTPSWNEAPNYDKQYLLKITGKMEPIEQRFTDVLQQKRLQTLQSVDDLVDKVCSELWMLGELDNTYIIYTSDHGYHLGQFGVIKGKALPYDFDTRVPFYMRGPGILPRSKISNVILNIDIAATILDIAGLDIPDHFDGKSLLRLIKSYRDPQNVDSKGFVKTRKRWGDTVLLERGKITHKRYKDMMREQKRTFMENLVSMPDIPDSLLQYATPKQRRIFKECAKPENQPPCKENQKYQCVHDPTRKLPRLQKCRPGDETTLVVKGDNPATCHCKRRRKRRRIPGHERRQRKLSQTHIKTIKYRSALLRKRRSYISSVDQNVNVIPVVQPIDRKCRVLGNNTVSCDQILYQDVDAWKYHKDQLDDMIQEYRKMLENLRKYRKHLKKEKPKETFLTHYDKTNDFVNVVGMPAVTPVCNCDENQTNYNAKKEAIKQARRERRRRKRKNKKRKRGKGCNKIDMSCSQHNNDHWKTPPLWNYGPFCFCSNSNNNTYWCLRTINSTHDLLYCEFINNFISYYDLTKDPFQLKNAIHDVNYGVLQQLHEQLNEMRKCQGYKECNKASQSTLETGRKASLCQVFLTCFTAMEASIDTSDSQKKSENDKQPSAYMIEERLQRDDAKSTYVNLMHELEAERERRWKAEQASIKLVDHIKKLQIKVKDGDTLNGTAMEATSRLKQHLTNEREVKLRLQDDVENLKEQIKTMTHQLSIAKETEDSYKKSLKTLEEVTAKMEREKLQQQTHEQKKVHDATMKSAALQRETEMLRSMVDKQKSQIHQLQDLLANREQQHRDELKKHYSPDSAELKELVDKEVKRSNQDYSHEMKTQHEKIEQLTKQYTELEDEFRMALQIEASRFNELKEAYQCCSEENAENKQALLVAHRKDEKSTQMLNELTALVKEQKGRITELSKCKQEQNIEYRNRVQNLEAQEDDARRKLVQLELLKQDKTKLLAQVEAQDSVISGLKAERKLWGQELAQQGSSLAQDRGRLEAKIETLNSEVITLKKTLNRETDALKIKSKMLEDQTETIRKLKEGLVERDEEIKKTREEALKTQRSLEEQLNEERAASQDIQERLDTMRERKDGLKHQLADIQSELEESKKAHSILNNKWKEKSQFIGQLEKQVQQMKDNWENKEKKLREERDKSVEAASAAIKKLRSVDDSFRKQLEAKELSHQTEINNLEQEKQAELDKAYQKIYEVEEEMRELLHDQNKNKKATEEKVKRLNKAIGELQSDLF